MLGERTPAFHPALVMCELDGATYDSRAAAAALSVSGGMRVAAWEARSVGARSDFELPAHLYLQFSAQPPSLTFERYSDWYQVHQDENIAQSRGARARVALPARASSAPARNPGRRISRSTSSTVSSRR